MSDKKRIDRKNVGKILIIIGNSIIVFVLAINVIDLIKNTIAINDFRKEQTQSIVKIVDDNGNLVSTQDSETVSEKTEPADEPDVEPNEKSTMCLLRIPKIKVEEAVREGSTQGVLSSALGHVENTALPGEDGNCCIAGHRNNVLGKYFNRLDEVMPGDVVEIETRDGLYIYEVTSMEVVEPEDVEVLAYAEGKNLTLITCTPFLIGTHRLIVHAVMK